MIRTFWTFAVGIASTLFHGTRVLVHSALGSRKLQYLADTAPRAWSRRIIRAANVRVRVENAEKLPEGSGQIIVSNHQSWFDVFAIAGFVPGAHRFVAKKELTKVPIFGPAWQAAGHIAIDRQDRSSAIESLGDVGRRIEEGLQSVIVFAEGTRSRDGKLQRFKKGAFVLAISAGVPVVPIAVLGTREIMPKGAWRVRPGTITIKIGDPIRADSLDHGQRDELSRRSRAAILELLGEGAEPASDADEQPPDPIIRATGS